MTALVNRKCDVASLWMLVLLIASIATASAQPPIEEITITAVARENRALAPAVEIDRTRIAEVAAVALTVKIFAHEVMGGHAALFAAFLAVAQTRREAVARQQPTTKIAILTTSHKIHYVNFLSGGSRAGSTKMAELAATLDSGSGVRKDAEAQSPRV